MIGLWEMDSQFDDCPIFVTRFTAALSFPAIAHVLPCVFQRINDRARNKIQGCGCRTSPREDQIGPNPEVLIGREDDPPTRKHMSKVEFLAHVRGDRRAYSPVNSEPSLERQNVREIKDVTSRGSRVQCLRRGTCSVSHS